MAMFCVSQKGLTQNVMLGVRDNQFARIGIIIKNNYFLIAEQSVLVTKLKNQFINGYIGYKGKYNKLTYSGYIYSGYQYSNRFRTYGGMVETGYDFFKYIKLYAGIRPHYDSSYGYDTAYKIGLNFLLNKSISIRGEYTSYPEFRLCEKRIKGGIDINVMNIYVSPQLSIPIDGNLENIRFLNSFNYYF